MRTSDIGTMHIIDRIYDASTLEDGIFWREELIRRLSSMILNANIMDPQSADEVAVYAAAKAQAEQAIARLQMVLARGEVFVWPLSGARVSR